MKSWILILGIALASGPLGGEEVPAAVAAIPAPLPAKFDIRPGDILETKVNRAGGRTVTFERIRPLALPEPPASPRREIDPAALRKERQRTEIFGVSATVYDRHRTYVRFWPNGRLEEEVAGWSSVDFNHLRGLARCSRGGREFWLVMMGIGNMDTAKLGQLYARYGGVYVPPVIPEMPGDGPAFVVTKGDATKPGALDLIEAIHEVYRAEGERLRLEFEERERAEAERKAWLKENPPVPQDVVLRHWRNGGKPVKPQAAPGR